MAEGLEIGGAFSHYRIISKIGEGGMGEVYLAEDTELGRQVALKVILPEIAADAERVCRFEREAKAASALNHPNILTVFEIGNCKGSRYIATEMIKGETLRDHLRGDHQTLRDSLGIAIQVAAALSAAHEAGIIHRDIKPENIMIRTDGLAKVLDFGLAKLTEKQTQTAMSEDATKAQLNTLPGLVMGTAAYMSPEQTRGRPLDLRSDIFSFGIVLFELFTGRRPFEGESTVDLVSSILKDDPPALRQIVPGLPRQLERIVDKTLRKDRDLRYQHVKDLQIDLEDLRDELHFEAKLNKTAETTLPISVRVTEADAVKPTLTESFSTTRRFTLLHAMIFGIVATGLIAGLWLYYARSGRPSGSTSSLKITEVATWNSAPGELYSRASFSPDGKMIAFASTRSGTKNIWVTQTNSTEAIRVTNDSFSNTDPIWSAKGDEIVYLSQRESMVDGRSSSRSVWRIPALGGTPRMVGALSDGSSQLRCWAASGKIYYQLQGDLYTLDIASGTSQKVTSFDRNNGRISWAGVSGDEKMTAYFTQSDDGWRFFIADSVGAAPTKAAEGLGEVGDGVAWLPEKNRIFFSVAVDGVSQIFVMDTGSGKSTRVTSSDTDSIVVDALFDGSSVIFNSAKEESNLWRVNVSDGKETPVARDLNSKLWPAVSPDNENVAFQSVKNLSLGNNLLEGVLAVKPLKGRTDDDNSTRIAEKGILPVWSPDGSVIAFLRKNGDKLDLVSANPNGGGEKTLETEAIPTIGYSVSPYNYVQTRAFSWSPDGTKIAFISEKNGASNIWEVNVPDASETALTDNTDPTYSFYCPIWSADGTRLAFFAQKKSPGETGKTPRELRLVDVAAGNTTRIFESSKVFRLIGWTADERGLIIAGSEKLNGLPPETVLTRVAIDTGAETTVVRLKNAYFYNIFLSDDRMNIAYAARNDDKDDIWVVPSTGGEARRITNNNDSGIYFSRLAWLHDGSAIAFGKQSRFSLLTMISGIK